MCRHRAFLFCSVSLFYLATQHRLVFEYGLQAVAYFNGPYADGRSRKENIADVQGHKLRDVRKKARHAKEHIARKALLHLLSVEV